MGAWVIRVTRLSLQTRCPRTRRPPTATPPPPTSADRWRLTRYTSRRRGGGVAAISARCCSSGRCVWRGRGCSDTGAAWPMAAIPATGGGPIRGREARAGQCRDMGDEQETGDERNRMNEEGNEIQISPSWACPHDGFPLLPVAGTPHWFQCGAEGRKHYFYRRPGSEGGGWIDVDTNAPVHAPVPKALSLPKARGRGRPVRPPAGPPSTAPPQSQPDLPE